MSQVECLTHQAKYMTNTSRYCALVGGFGCGKSYAVGLRAYMSAYLNQGFDGMIVSRTGEQLKKLVKEVVKAFRMCGLNYDDSDIKRFQRDGRPFTFTKYGDRQLVIKYGQNTFTNIYLGTTENYAYEKWAGGNLAWVVIDEIDTMPHAEEVWKFANDRVRVGNFNQSACASTPEGYGFLWDFFENQVTNDPTLTDRAIIRGCTLDSPYINKEYVLNQIRTRDPVSMRAYIYGEFCNLDGSLVYWAFDKNKNLTPNTLSSAPSNAVLYIGIDFNKNINACTISYVQNDILYTVHEIYGCKGTYELIQELNQVLRGRSFYIYPDGTGFEGIQQLERAYGEDCVIYTPGNPLVQKRVTACNQRLSSNSGMPRALVNKETCPRLWAGLLRQTKDAKGVPDKTKGLDHSLDGWGYKIHHLWPAEDSVGQISRIGDDSINPSNYNIRSMLSH